MTTTSIHITTRTEAFPVRRTALLTSAAAIATNVAVFSLARSRDVNFRFLTPGSANAAQTVGFGAVIGVTLVAMIAGWAAVALTRRGDRLTLGAMAIIGGVIAVLSCAGPLTINAASSVKLTLAALHLITGLYYVAGVTHLGRASAGETR
jgi:Family of unknown function (DUF6069)